MDPIILRRLVGGQSATAEEIIQQMFDDGMIGGWYKKDLAYLFQDKSGKTPVTADGDPVALVVSAAGKTGAEIITNNAFDSAAGWTVNAGWSVTGGQAVATDASASLRWITDLVDQSRYLVEFDVVVTSGTLGVNCGANPNENITTSGHYALHLTCGGAYTGGLYFNPTSFTGTLDNVSLKPDDPFTLYQTNTALRGVYKSGAVPYIEWPSTAWISTSFMDFTLPAYVGLGISRNTESGPLVCSGFGSTNGIQIATSNGNYALGLTLAKSGVFSNVPAPSGSFSPNVPCTVDILCVAGETTSWINGGSRYVDDHSAGAAGGLVSKSNTWTGAESYGTSVFAINATGAGSHTGSQCRLYGGVVTLGDPGAARASIHRWLLEQESLSTLKSPNYDIFLTAGQSNALGVGTLASSPSVPFGNAVEFRARGGVHPLADPVQGEGVSASLYGSAWPSFANQYLTSTGRKVCIIGNAASSEGLVFTGTARGGWLGSELVPSLAAKLAAALAAGVKGTVRGVLYAGGEQDVLADVTKASYKESLVTFRNNLRTATGIPTLPLLILSLDNLAGSEAKYTLLRDAQSEAATENEGIELVMPYQEFIDDGKTSDGIHWNQTALNEAGVIAAISCAALFP